MTTSVSLCFEDERLPKSMNFIVLSLIVVIVSKNSSTSKVLEEKACALRGETPLSMKKTYHC